MTLHKGTKILFKIKLLNHERAAVWSPTNGVIANDGFYFCSACGRMGSPQRHGSTEM
jgi:hypothetical protein